MAGVAAISYCDALFEIAQEQKKLDDFKEQLELITTSIKENVKFQNVMHHPKIRKEEKKALLETIYHDSCDALLLNFLKLLVDKNRFRALPAITKEFVKRYNIVNHIQVVQVKSAYRLDNTQEQKLRTALEQKLHKKVELVIQIDEDLIAGIRIKINDQIIDNSALSRLVRLKKAVVASEGMNK